MKKLLSLLLALCMCFSVCLSLSSCGHEHTYVNEWSKDATHHWYACQGTDCPEIKEKAEHTWSAGVITTDPTPTSDGVMTYTCTVCQWTKSEPVEYAVISTVTEAEWNTAFLFDTDGHTITSESGGVAQVTLFDGSTVKVSGTDGAGNSLEQYFAEEAGKYYFYSAEDGDVRKSEISEETYNSTKGGSMDNMFVYSNFVYDEDSESYKSIEDISLYDGMLVYSDIEIKFEDGKLVSASFGFSLEGAAAVPSTMTVTYGSVETIELPTIGPAPVVYTVTEQEWRTNFNLTSGASSVAPVASTSVTEITSYTIYAEGVNYGINGTCLLKVAPNAMSIEFYLEEVLREDESGTYPNTDVFYNGLTTSIKMYFPFADKYDTFTFDEDKNAYVAERFVSVLTDEYDPSDTYELYTKTAEVTFINGYLNTVTVELCDENYEYVYSSFVFTFSDINNTTVAE